MYLADTIDPQMLVSSLLGAMVTILGSLVLLITGILKNNTFQDTLMNYFAKSLNKEIIDKSDIETHEIFIKLKSIASDSYFFKFLSPSKAKLYKKYTTITAEIFYFNLQELLKKDLKTYNEATLKVEVSLLLLTIFNNIEAEFYKHLQSINNDEVKLNIINNKIRTWRYDTKVILEQNMSVVLSNGKFVSSEYKLNRVFDILSMGFDFYLKNGTESFEKLNGELESFLEK